MSKYITNKEIQKLIEKGIGIYVFGCGIDSEQLCDMTDIEKNVISFIDNRRSFDEARFREKRILSLSQVVKKNDVIVIAAGRFNDEIEKQLISCGYHQKKDYYIWDEFCLYHWNDEVKKMNDLMKELCFLKDTKKHNSVVIIPFDNKCELTFVKYAYMSNYLANIYDADIYSYFRWGANTSGASPVLLEMYRSFGCKGIIDDRLVDKNKVNEEFNRIWESIETWEDINKITIEGISFGVSIVRDYMRVGIPDFVIKNKQFESFLYNRIETIVFWLDYFKCNDVKAVILGDGVTWDGYIRDIALNNNIKTYATVSGVIKKMYPDFYDEMYIHYYRNMWEQLYPDIKEKAITLAKNIAESRLRGDVVSVSLQDKENFPFKNIESKDRVIRDNGKVNVMICPHIFEEDCYACGESVFDNNYFEWLIFLGEMSNITDYNWYLKMHPSASKRDYIIIDKILKKYKNIVLLHESVSPKQLAHEGLDYVLTVYGSVGHEYPLLGVKVINAGDNPHMNYSFNINPKDKTEYAEVIKRLDKKPIDLDRNEIYEFYAMNYVVYDKRKNDYDSIFFENKTIAYCRTELVSAGYYPGTWLYAEFSKEWSLERRDEVIKELPTIFQNVDEWEPYHLYIKEDLREVKR